MEQQQHQNDNKDKTLQKLGCVSADIRLRHTHVSAMKGSLMCEDRIRSFWATTKTSQRVGDKTEIKVYNRFVIYGTIFTLNWGALAHYKNGKLASSVTWQLTKRLPTNSLYLVDHHFDSKIVPREDFRNFTICAGPNSHVRMPLTSD